MSKLMRSSLLLALVTCALLAAGCGDDDDGGNSGSPAPTPAATTQDGGGAADEPAGGDAAGAVAEARKACEDQARSQLSGADEAQALKLCESATKIDPSDAANTLSEKAKEKVREAQELARKGDQEGAIKAAREACAEQAKSRLDGAAESTAIELCNKSLTAP